MKLIESSVQIIEEKDPYKMIELAGRTCYKSEDKITENSAKEFVDRMIKLGHGAMLELTFKDLYYEADQAMYYSKRQGKNRISFFDSIRKNGITVPHNSRMMKCRTIYLQ